MATRSRLDTKSDGKVLVIHTDAAGDLTVKFDAIQSITSAGDLNITLGGKTAVGPVTTSGTDVVVATRAGTPVEAPMSSITLVRSPAEQAAYEKTLHPGSDRAGQAASIWLRPDRR